MITNEFIAEVLRSSARGKVKILLTAHQQRHLWILGVNPANNFFVDSLLALIAQVGPIGRNTVS